MTATLSGAPPRGAPVPDGSRAQRRTSRDPDAFGVPTGREEQWRFTPMRRLAALLEPGTTGTTTISVAAPAAVRVDRVSTQDARIGTVLAPADRVSALALAEVEEAVVVTVPAEAVLDQPVTITLDTGEGVSQAHVAVELGPYARATVIVEHVGTGSLAANLELRIGDGAALDFVSVQSGSRESVLVEAQAAAVGRDARLHATVITLGGDLVRLTPTVRFTGPGGNAELAGLFLTSEGQHHEHQLYVCHEVPHCRSRVTYKGALQGQGAHSVWVGDVLIGAKAEGTDTYETNRNLVLTDGARADSVPNLEIETGEVAGAGHASATGRFDDEQLFYLMARGIPEVEARRLVVRGFFADVLLGLPLPDLRARLLGEVDALLGAL